MRCQVWKSERDRALNEMPVNLKLVWMGERPLNEMPVNLRIVSKGEILLTEMAGNLNTKLFFFFS